MTLSRRPLRRPPVDAKTSALWRARRPPAPVSATRPPPAAGPVPAPVGAVAEASCKVVEADLGRIGAIQELLVGLSDQYASGRNVGALVTAIPVLAARILRRASRHSSGSDGPIPIDRALVLVGNRGVEAELLELLEDLTILKADLEDGA